MNSLTLFWMECEPLGLLCTGGQVRGGRELAESCAFPTLPWLLPTGG